GTARGGVPSARIAVYKICFETCLYSDILAAFDDAIADGVDIISISLGGSRRLDYFQDPIAIGAFHAMKNNILTSSSAGNASTVFFWLTVTYSVIFSDTLAADTNDLKTYIVYLGDIPKISIPVSSVHISMLRKIIGSRASKSLLRSYTRSFSGFVARLTEDEKNQIARLKGVVSVFPNGKKQLHTTRSWDFIGFPQDVVRAPLESDIIVGMLDTGVWPESDSFKDDGFGPPPSRWRGSCDSNNFTCNNKLIGARYYNTDDIFTGEELSARDTDGHGTHTASTVAGRAVNSASLLGLANGTARGGVPSARIAVYKICFETCSYSDILAGFDDAIADGVDIISISIGGSRRLDYFQDPIAIGAFHAMKNNILTSSSAGNGGPSLGSTRNVSPWSLSVAASSIDRKFLTQIVLGNNQTYMGRAINTFDGAVHSIVYGASVPNTMNGSTSADSRFCTPNSLDPILVKDKIVVCESVRGPENALLSGASGVVIEGDHLGREDVSYTFPIATTYLNSQDGEAVLSYINSTSTPTASILKSIEPVDIAAPTVVSFSSRGPNLITLDILKPDLTAPGVDILAAWSQDSTITGLEGDTRVVPYNIISGTSMSCPHASGAAAYVKSFHNDWSPAAIKSALMTTAAPMSPIKNPDAEFAYGSGHINPLKAVNPGLVYDAGEADYVSFLCGQGYDAMKLRTVTGDTTACSAANNATVWDLNYPSFTLSSNEPGIIVRRFNRIVTNVGLGESTYQAKVFSPLGLVVDVSPSTLVFTKVGEKQSFLVTVTATIGSNILSGSLVWNDGAHSVTSPIVAPDRTSFRDRSRGKSLPHRWDSSSGDRPERRDYICGVGESYDNSHSSYETGINHEYRYRDRDRSRHTKRGRDSESPLSRVSKSDSSDGRHWMSKRHKPTDEDSLTMTWMCGELDPFTPRIRATRVWFDELPPESIDGYKDLKAAFLAYFMQQKKYVKDPVEIHNIKQKDRETIKDFMKRFKVETRRIKGAPKCKLSDLIKEIKQGRDQSKVGKKEAPSKDKPTKIYMIQSWKRKTRQKVTQIFERVKEITFPSLTASSGKEGPLVIEAGIDGHIIHRMYVDVGSSTEVLYEHCFNQLRPKVKNKMVSATTSLTGFSRETIWPLGQLRLMVTIGDADHSTRAWMNFMIVRSLSLYNGIIGRPGIKKIQAVPSTAHEMLKFPADGGIVTICSTILIPAECATVITSSKEIPKRGWLKEQVLADFLAEMPDENPPDASVVKTQQEPWTLFTDGSSCVDGSVLERGKKAMYQGSIVRIIGGDSLQAVIPYAVVKVCQITPSRLYDREIHEGSCSMHARPRSVVAKAIWLGYYWPTMHRDARNMIRTCNDSQIQRPVTRNPQQPLTPITAPCPFYKWGIDIAGPFSEGPVIQAEIGMPTYRTAEVDVVHNDEDLRLNLDLLEERRERAAIREAKAKLKMTKYYNVKVRDVTFRPGDFVYRSNDASHAVDGGKLGPKWEGPYEVTKALGDAAYKLRSADGTVLPRTWNFSNLKKCYL
nr:cucumisin-like [Tanacetum cinerariifolium]